MPLKRVDRFIDVRTILFLLNFHRLGQFIGVPVYIREADRRSLLLRLLLSLLQICRNFVIVPLACESLPFGRCVVRPLQTEMETDCVKLPFCVRFVGDHL